MPRANKKSLYTLRRSAGRGGRPHSGKILTIPNTIVGGGGGGGSVTVTSCSPSTGSAGRLITIIGSGFANGQVVLLGGSSMGSIVVVNSTTIQATVPAGLTVANPITCNLSVSGVTLANAVQVFASGDITDNASFETDWSGFGKGSANATPTIPTRDNTVGYIGTTSVKFHLPRSGWKVTACTNASPPVVTVSAVDGTLPNFTTGQQCGFFGASGAVINSAYTNANRFLKNLTSSTFEVYTDAACTVPLAAPGVQSVAFALASDGDINADWHYNWYNNNGQNGYIAAITRGSLGEPRIYHRFRFKVNRDFATTVVGNTSLQFILKMPGILQRSGFAKFDGWGLFQNHLSYNIADEWGGGYINVATSAAINDGQWHTCEADVQFRGNTDNGGNDYISSQLWFDGVDVAVGGVSPITGLTISAQPSISGGQVDIPNNRRPDLGAWINGRINAGSRFPYIQQASYLIGAWTGTNILNGANPVDGDIWIDDISISTLGRVGP